MEWLEFWTFLHSAEGLGEFSERQAVEVSRRQSQIDLSASEVAHVNRIHHHADGALEASLDRFADLDDGFGEVAADYRRVDVATHDIL